ncbi:hypothetical protein [Streptomyces anandii]|uniref:hypothetical protein n=1 Tax=Streptomyces anandii TaxID=285454 RepID=UPI00367CDAA1
MSPGSVVEIITVYGHRAHLPPRCVRFKAPADHPRGGVIQSNSQELPQSGRGCLGQSTTIARPEVTATLTQIHENAPNAEIVQ